MTTEQTGRLSLDTTDSLTPIDLETPILVAPAGGDPTPLPQTRAADGTRKLKVPPPIPSRTSTPDLAPPPMPRTQSAELTAMAGGTDTRLRAAPRATLPPPIPSRTTTPTRAALPAPSRAKGTVPPPIPMRATSEDAPEAPAVPRTQTAELAPTMPTVDLPAAAPVADPDGWTVAPTTDDGLRDILAPDPEGPDVTRPTPFVEPAATAPLDAAPSPEWLAKIDAVMRPQTSAPVLFTTNALPTTQAAVELFTTKAEAPSTTQPLELVDLEPVPAQPTTVIVAPQPVIAPAPHPVAAVAGAIGAAPAVSAPVARPVTPAALPTVAPVAAPYEHVPAVASAPMPAAAAAVSLPAYEAGFDIDFDADLTSAHTTNFEMPAKRRFLSQRSAIAIFAGAAVLTVAYLATRGGHTKTSAPAKAAATAKAETPAPVAAPAAVTPTAAPAPAAQNIAAPAPATQEVAAAPAPAGDATLMRMPVTSKPSGALVTFVDGGKAVVVGRTPTTISFDPRQTHDVALTLIDHETQLVTIPNGGMTALVVDMGPAKTGAASPTVPHVATEVAATRPETPAPKHHTSAPAPAPKAPPAQKIAQPAPRLEAPAAMPAGGGVLMISSKPPCEIIVDGKSTHLMTPQRSLPLAAGNHTIMLVNAQQKIHKTLPVTILAKKSTKVIQDFTNH